MKSPSLIRPPLAAALALAAALLVAPLALAEDLKGKWYFGGSISYLTTLDDIRSNAALSIGPTNQPYTCFDVQLGVYCDLRPDSLEDQSMGIDESLKYEITAGFGLSSWFSLQADVGYFRGDLGKIDAYLKERVPAAFGFQPTNLGLIRSREGTVDVRTGTLTEIPVSLTGIFRFRKDKNLNPYFGVGVGRVFAEVDVDPDIAALNRRIDGMRIRGITDEANRVLDRSLEGTLSFDHPLSLDVDDSGEWHLVAGTEWFMNERVSMVVDARYTITSRSVVIDLVGEDQVNLLAFPEEMFRADGSLRIFVNQEQPPNPFCKDSNSKIRYGCDPSLPGYELRRVVCSPGEFGDFDGDGNANGTEGVDLCYDAALLSGSPPRADLLVQGGRIDLTSLSVNLGLRIKF